MAFKRKKLKNNITLITKAVPTSSVVALSIVIKAGSKYEKKGQRGYVHFLEHVLLKGSTNHQSSSIYKEIEMSGAWFNAFTNIDFIRLSIVVSAQKLPRLLGLLCDMISKPAITKEHIKTEKNVLIQERNNLFDSREARGWVELSKKMFKEHPLGNFPIGEEKDIHTASAEKIAAYYKQQFLSTNTAVFAIGKIKRKTIEQILEKRLSLPTTKKTKNDQQKNIPINKKREQILIKKDEKQTHIAIGYRLPPLTFKESLCLDLIASHIGYKKTSVLYKKLRESQGLVYSINTASLLFDNACVLYIATASSNPKEVLKIIEEEMLSINKSFSKQELKNRKDQLINLQKRIFSTHHEEVLFMMKNWLLYKNKNIDTKSFEKELKKITLKDCSKIISDLKKTKPVVVLIGKTK